MQALEIATAGVVMALDSKLVAILFEDPHHKQFDKICFRRIMFLLSYLTHYYDS